MRKFTKYPSSSVTAASKSLMNKTPKQQEYMWVTRFKQDPAFEHEDIQFYRNKLNGVCYVFYAKKVEGEPAGYAIYPIVKEDIDELIVEKSAYWPDDYNVYIPTNYFDHYDEVAQAVLDCIS